MNLEIDEVASLGTYLDSLMNVSTSENGRLELWKAL
jgi:hypothetical protein